jgi:hypothetical protein
MINRDMTLTIMLSQKLNLVNIRIWSHSLLEKKKKKRKMSMNNDPFPKETTIMATSMLEMMPCKSCPRYSIEV